MTNTIITIPLKTQSTAVMAESDKILYVPLATRETPGIIYVGAGLDVDEGVLSVNIEHISESLDYRVTIDAINSRIDDNVSRIEALEEELDLSQYAKIVDLDAAKARITLLEADNETTKQDIVSLNSNIDNINSDIENISNEITEITTDLSTIHTNIETLTGGLQDADDKITDIENDVDQIQLLIPEQATISNQLADKAFVNSTVQTSTANYRGSWESWADVPTDVNQYPEDFAGNKKPTVNDYLVVRVADDYHGEDIFTRVGETTGKYIDDDGSIKDNSDFAYSAKLNIPDEDDTYVRLILSANVAANIRVHAYAENDVWLGQVVFGRTEIGSSTISVTGELPENTLYVRVSYPTATTSATLFTCQLVGTWRFKYTGNWDTKGKDGWEPEYQINETPLTIAQVTALNSGVTPELTNQITLNKLAIATHTEQITLINSSLQDLGSDITELRNDLNDKVSFTDYATSSKAGVIIAGNGLDIYSDHKTYAPTQSYANYLSAGNGYFIGKGTLENIKNNYVKDGLTNNSIVLTEQEQDNFKAWMNISSEKGVFVIRTSEEV